jgi:hypothetical protein
MTVEEDARPFYEEPWFKGTAAVLGVVAVVFTLVGPPKLWDVISDAFSSELPPDNTQYILDASAAMGVPFGDEGTKLTAAARTIARAVAPHEAVGLALRRFGGTCEERGDLLVDFGEGRADEVAEAAADQDAAGESNLANAVIAAIDDYNDDDRFPSDRDIKKRIVVVTGSADACLGEDASEQIRRRITQTGIELDFTFVGVAVPEEERDRLRAVASDLESPALFADTDDELADVVEYLEIEPVVRDGETASEIHNTVIEELNVFNDALNNGNLAPAERALRRSEAALEDTQAPYERIGERQTRPAFVELYGVLGRAREIQRELIALGETRLDLRRELDEDGNQNEYANAVAEWDGVIARQIETRDRLQEAHARLVDLLPIVEG